MPYRFTSILAIWAFAAAATFMAAARAAAENGPRLGKQVTMRYRAGWEINAGARPCKGIVAMAPVPFEWPEQEVRVVDEDVTPNVRSVDFRLVDGAAKQMIIEIPYLAPGEEARAIFTYEVTRSWILPPDDPARLVIPKRMDRQTRRMLAPSPGIESRHPRIRKLARELVQRDDDAWQQVKAMYDWVRANVQYVNGPFKGAIAALKDKNGDCEELSSLFIALCRANGIPARTVWIPGHCYPEFYLQDEAGQGYWFPCQAAGEEAFGEMPESRPVLQKGDNFRHPTEKRRRMRYMAEVLTADDGEPQLRPVRELLGEVR